MCPRLVDKVVVYHTAGDDGRLDRLEEEVGPEGAEGLAKKRKENRG